MDKQVIERIGKIGQGHNKLQEMKLDNMSSNEVLSAALLIASSTLAELNVLIVLEETKEIHGLLEISKSYFDIKQKEISTLMKTNNLVVKENHSQK